MKKEEDDEEVVEEEKEREKEKEKEEEEEPGRETGTDLLGGLPMRKRSGNRGKGGWKREEGKERRETEGGK